MARKMKKFSEGGSDKYKAKYDRKVADIESDYKKAQDRKTGRAAEIAKAKYDQRMADAKDDLAKWTKSDRTATRAAESAAEKNLSMTRKYGARSSEGLVAKAEEKLAAKAPLSSVDTSALNKPKTTSFKEAFAAARKNPEAMKAGKFTWNGKSYSTAIAGEKKTAPKVSRPAAKVSRPAPKTESKPAVKVEDKPKAAASTIRPPASLSLANKGKTPAPTANSLVKAPASLSLANKGKNVPAEPTFDQKRAARLEEWRKAAEAPGASTYVKDRYKYGKETGMVGNFKKGGPVMESQRKPIDTRRAILGSDKEIVARGNRTPYEPIPKKGPDAPKRKPLGRAGAAGYKSGGSVMKKGADGIAKKGKTKGMMPKMNKGGACYAKGGSIDGIAKKGKTRCKGMK